MRVLILSCNTGGGHNACAGAIRQSFQNCGDICDIEDSIRFCSGKLSGFMSWGHTTMYRHIPRLFSFGYGFAEKHPSMIKDDASVYKLLTSGANKLRQFMIQGQYDTLICTHVFSGLLVHQMQRKAPLGIKTAFVATDYTCSPGTANSMLDLYFIPSPALCSEYMEQGVPEKKLVPCGIPIRSEFYHTADKELSKEKCGVGLDHFHVLVMCGSMGCGPMKLLAKQLYARMDARCEISLVCGMNEKLYKQLSNMFRNVPNVHIYGYVQDVSALMDSADLYVTKPGGLSTSEAAAKRLPMVLLDVVSGCEEHNMDFFVKTGGAVMALGVDGVVGRCLVLAKEPEKLEQMRNALAAHFPGNAADTISETMHKQEAIQ